MVELHVKAATSVKYVCLFPTSKYGTSCWFKLSCRLKVRPVAYQQAAVVRPLGYIRIRAHVGTVGACCGTAWTATQQAQPEQCAATAGAHTAWGAISVWQGRADSRVLLTTWHSCNAPIAPSVCSSPSCPPR